MNNRNDGLRELFSAKEAMQEFGFSRAMTYALLNRKDTGVVRIGARKFFHRDTFLNWLENLAKTGEEIDLGGVEDADS